MCQNRPPRGSDLTGGWINGGPAGNLKMTMPTAFTTSLLAWGLLSFGSGYSQSNATANSMQQIKCAEAAHALQSNGGPMLPITSHIKICVILGTRP